MATGGKGKASYIYKERVAKVFDAAGISVTLQVKRVSTLHDSFSDLVRTFQCDSCVCRICSDGNVISI
jgi:hypothetical protein